jgi:hypothetical protein
MKIREFITEMRIGKYASGGIIPSSSPITRKNSKIAYDTVKAINDAPTAKDKIDIITNLEVGRTTNQILVTDQKGNKYGFKEYNKQSGDIELIDRRGNPYRTNVDYLEFVGKERSMSTSIKKWVFTSSKISALDIEKPTPKPDAKKKGRPAKPIYTMPTW